MAPMLGLRLPDALRRLPIDDVVAMGQQAGLDVLDLPADFAAAARACRSRGMGIGSVDGGVMGELISADDAVREQASASLSEQVAAMGGVGLTTLFLCLVPRQNDQPIARSLEYFKDSFPVIARACEAAGVRIAFEGYPGPMPYYPTLGYTPEVWRAMFAAVPSPALGLCYDPSHLARLGIDYLRVVEEFGDRLYHCHGKDTALLPEQRYLYGAAAPALRRAPRFSGGAWRYCVPGDGVVDWAAVAEALDRSGYTGCVCIELEDARFTGSAEDEWRGVRKSLEHLARHFR